MQQTRQDTTNSKSDEMPAQPVKTSVELSDSNSASPNVSPRSLTTNRIYYPPRTFSIFSESFSAQNTELLNKSVERQRSIDPNSSTTMPNRKTPFTLLPTTSPSSNAPQKDILSATKLARTASLGNADRRLKVRGVDERIRAATDGLKELEGLRRHQEIVVKQALSLTRRSTTDLSRSAETVPLHGSLRRRYSCQLAHTRMAVRTDKTKSEATETSAAERSNSPPPLPEKRRNRDITSSSSSPSEPLETHFPVGDNTASKKEDTQKPELPRRHSVTAVTTAWSAPDNCDACHRRQDGDTPPALPSRAKRPPPSRPALLPAPCTKASEVLEQTSGYLGSSQHRPIIKSRSQDSSVRRNRRSRALSSVSSDAGYCSRPGTPSTGLRHRPSLQSCASTLSFMSTGSFHGDQLSPTASSRADNSFSPTSSSRPQTPSSATSPRRFFPGSSSEHPKSIAFCMRNLGTVDVSETYL